jgi:hypothetical protein
LKLAVFGAEVCAHLIEVLTAKPAENAEIFGYFGTETRDLKDFCEIFKKSSEKV